MITKTCKSTVLDHETLLFQQPAKELDSGETERRGRITRQGNRVVRSLLVEVTWVGLRHNPWVRANYQRISGGKKSRKKIAVVAVGRKLLVRCWAMLRDGTPWHWQPSST